MANYATLKAAIQDVIKTNNNNEITGALLQQSLLAMIDSMGCVGYEYVGVATPATNPGTPDQNVFYIASTPGTYANFNGLVVNDNEVAIFNWNGEWSKSTTGAANAAYLNNIKSDVNINDFLLGKFDVSDDATVGFYNSNGTINTTDPNAANWRCGQFDATGFQNKVLFLHLGIQNQPSLNCYVKLSNNTIVSIGNYVVSNYNVSAILAVIVPSNADLLLLSWAAGTTYLTPRAFAFCGLYSPLMISDGANNLGYNINHNGQDIASVPRLDQFVVGSKELALEYTTTDGWIGIGGATYDSPAIFYKSGFIAISQLGRVNSVIISGKGHPAIAHISFWTSSNTFISGVAGNTEGEQFTKTANIPSNAEYFRLSGYVDDPIKVSAPALSFEQLDAILPVVAQHTTQIQQLQGALYDASIPYNAFGDSITEGVGATGSLGSYAKRLNAKFHFSAFYNYGLSATSFCKQNNSYGIIYSRTHNLSNFAGLITVAGGTNDYGNNHSPLGTLESIINKTFEQLTEPSTTYVEGYTFAEAFRYTIEDLKRNNPNAKILVLLPTNRANENVSNGYGTLQDYRNLMMQICQCLGIEYVDMTKCGLPIYNSATYFRLVSDVPDGLHPNDFGYYLMTSFLIPRIEAYL